MELTKDQQIYNFNMEVLSKEKTLRNIDKIIKIIKYGVLAKYNLESKHWNYQKYKGPTFLISDTYQQKKIVIMNQCSIENYVFKIEEDTKFQLVKLPEGFLFNYTAEDSIGGLVIYSIWTMDSNIGQIYTYLSKS